MEHYLELYSTQNIVTDTALNAQPGLPVIEELDNTPTLEEFSITIDGLACSKAPWKDGIPPDVLKHGKQTILQPLHELLCLCWEQGHILQDMRDANIVTLYKNKGDRSDCDNNRGISLLSIVGKVFPWVTLTRMQSLASQVYPESQCGFRAGRSTVDDLCQARAETQRIPPPLPSAPAAHQVAGQIHQHRGPGVPWLTEHAITAHSATPSMARPCTSHRA